MKRFTPPPPPPHTHTHTHPSSPSLAQILGDWFERGSIIVFVDTKEAADAVFLELAKAGYPALSLHGGKEQADRDQTIADFKTGARTLLVATSVAGRGLDVQVRVLGKDRVFHCALVLKPGAEWWAQG
jgi:superfamily II DNA/RNA helicase